MQQLIMGLVAAFLFSVSAQAADPAPYTIDLKKIILDGGGQPMKNVTDRASGVMVLSSFESDGKQYPIGTVITDPDEIELVSAALQAKKAEYSIGQIDPACMKCGVVTYGWLFSQALVRRVCPLSPQQPKTRFCTVDEQKHEEDELYMIGRQHAAGKIAKEDTMEIGPKSALELENLVAARFDDNPLIMSQVLAVLTPTAQPTKWGQE